MHLKIINSDANTNNNITRICWSIQRGFSMHGKVEGLDETFLHCNAGGISSCFSPLNRRNLDTTLLMFEIEKVLSSWEGI